MRIYRNHSTWANEEFEKKLNGYLHFRQNHRHQVGRPEEAEGPGPEEDLERVGRVLRRLPREGRLHQEDRTAEAEIRQK